ncbi:hypothetical protein MSTO_30440 [Mycobacterium stomatepiae]|uniref:DUF1214 domain-containing protein n=1 Tax=Mycobacterium stomatepiae TaxID=470076 RepID=A0A7I7Q982_9MYCO|nr:hypothetical protein MSTO_30440 [Mycobacterium stomatepiae]
MPNSKAMFGAKDDSDPVRHLIGSAVAWGGNPEKDAIYFAYHPAKIDGAAKYRLTLGEVPVDGFWSVSVYNWSGSTARAKRSSMASGHFQRPNRFRDRVIVRKTPRVARPANPLYAPWLHEVNGGY